KLLERLFHWLRTLLDMRKSPCSNMPVNAGFSSMGAASYCDSWPSWALIPIAMVIPKAINVTFLVLFILLFCFGSTHQGHFAGAIMLSSIGTGGHHCVHIYAIDLGLAIMCSVPTEFGVGGLEDQFTPAVIDPQV